MLPAGLMTQLNNVANAAGVSPFMGLAGCVAGERGGPSGPLPAHLSCRPHVVLLRGFMSCTWQCFHVRPC